MKALAIVNRKAGGTSLATFALHLKHIARNADVVFTQHTEHAREVVTTSTSVDTFIVVGGDGTLFDVMNSMDMTRQRLAIVPMGRGNSLARDLGLFPAEASMRALRERATRRIDVLDVSFVETAGTRKQCRSASTVAVGYPAAVVRLAGERFRVLGRYCYAMAATLARPSPGMVTVIHDGAAARERCLTGVIANNTKYLANFVGFPNASAADGAFDLMEMRAGLLRQNLHNVSALSRLHFYEPAVPRRSQSVSVVLGQPSDLMVDGELFADVTAVDVTIRPNALEVICPPARP